MSYCESWACQGTMKGGHRAAFGHNIFLNKDPCPLSIREILIVAHTSIAFLYVVAGHHGSLFNHRTIPQ